MKAAGIICEYNPFHNGHIYHIRQTRAITGCDVLICVMSGHFVQRGEPAIIDKRQRCKAALNHGVDLVIELPFVYATQSAAYFAYGAVASLALAHVSDIVFGSESNDISALTKIASLPSPDDASLSKELSIAKAYEILYGKKQPNDILGINYIKEMQRYHINAHCIKRTTAYHDADLGDNHFAGAAALRSSLLQRADISAYTPMQIAYADIHTLAEYYPYLQGLLFTLSKDYLRTLLLMDEGIEQHLLDQAKRCDTLDDFLRATTSRRYPTSRIRRTLIHLLHQTTKESVDHLPPLSHIRILGFNSIGRAYLKQLKQYEDVCIASRINQLPLPYRNMELRSAQMYGLCHDRQKILTQELQPPVFV